MNIAIIIPAYNPPNTFSSLIENISILTNNHLIIVDDGTIPPIDIKQKNITLIRNKINHGKGYALKKAFNHAFNEGFTHAITLDADSQHDPSLIKAFSIIDEDISMVLGTRNFSREMPFHRRLSNFLTSKVISYLCKVTILDSQCGYRRYKLIDLASKSFIENGFQFESEVLIKLLRNKISVKTLEIPTTYNNEKSAINNFLDTYKFIRLICRNLIKK